jgi:RNA-directed DNA polymerase
MKFLEHQIADKRVLRIIQKWLKAGIVENGYWAEYDARTPQRRRLRRLSANMYLHYVSSDRSRPNNSVDDAKTEVGG